MLIGIIRFYYVKRGERLVIIYEWPIVSWIIEIVIYITGIRVETIYSDITPRERESIINKFNELASSLKILIGISRLIR